MGRVKDSFELDKMFFIVNAADLASSGEELEGVVTHVSNNLQQHGIRHPRIYPMSSYYALEGKLAQEQETVQASGISAFEQDFVRFSLGELTDIAIRSGQADLLRAADVLQQWIVSAQSDEQGRQARATAIRKALGEADVMLRNQGTEAEERELLKEIEELLYYVKQRATYRFGELFNLAFNPAVFREEGRSALVIAGSAWNDLQQMIAFDLSQEVLAITLRIENAIHNRAAKEDSSGCRVLAKSWPHSSLRTMRQAHLRRRRAPKRSEPNLYSTNGLLAFTKMRSISLRVTVSRICVKSWRQHLTHR